MLDVPHGTKTLRFQPLLREAIMLGLKTESRRPLTASNSRLTRGDFEDLDLASARPDGLWPVSCLKCRIATSSGRRTTTVCPLIRANTLLWPRVGQAGPDAKRENVRALLRVTRVEARRLNDLTEQEAIAEGVWIYRRHAMASSDWQTEDEIAHAVYLHLMGKLGKVQAARWRRGPIHQDIVGRAPSARDCFALMWESINGSGSWQANPWVWRYQFERVPITETHPDESGSAHPGPP